jgi:CxxC motif-containing protein (DUF1111 family)
MMGMTRVLHRAVLPGGHPSTIEVPDPCLATVEFYVDQSMPLREPQVRCVQAADKSGQVGVSRSGFT